MKKIAIVIHRYGIEVNGGAEYYARLIAEHLTEKYEVEVLTTKAMDYVTWEDYYKISKEEINGVTVRRFSVDKPRRMDVFAQVQGHMMGKKNHTKEELDTWLEEQGPYSPQLIQYIEDHKADYDLFVFVTYLYHNTCAGMERVRDKAVLISTAHDEPWIYFDVYKDVFQKCQAIVYLTDEEKKFVEGQFHNENIPNIVTAIGVDVPETETKKNPKLGENYITYVGRIDEIKGCDRLFKYFREYKKRNNSDLKLALMGKAVIDIPEDSDIVNLGFVSEEEKFEGIRNAKALILPSHFESLSISVLEALTVGTPVIVSGHCEVLKGHCIKSNAGLYYKDYFEFEGCLNYLMSHEDERSIMSENGKKYIEKYYRWDVVVDNLTSLFDGVINKQ